MIHYAQSKIANEGAASKWIRFDRTNALDAKIFLGRSGWFYTREDLYLSDTRPESCAEKLTAIDDESEKPFGQGSGRGMVWCKYFVIRQH